MRKIIVASASPKLRFCRCARAALTAARASLRLRRAVCRSASLAALRLPTPATRSPWGLAASPPAPKGSPPSESRPGVHPQSATLRVAVRFTGCVRRSTPVPPVGRARAALSAAVSAVIAAPLRGALSPAANSLRRGSLPGGKARHRQKNEPRGCAHPRGALRVRGPNTRKESWSLDHNPELRNIRIKRVTGFEPATSSLGSWHSTTELHPQLLWRHFNTIACAGNTS